MNAELQTLIALAVVAITAAALLVRSLVKRKNPGCGGDCACPTTQLKTKLRR
jgi:FeoB-associated Cys-rich membrane protein